MINLLDANWTFENLEVNNLTVTGTFTDNTTTSSVVITNEVQNVDNTAQIYLNTNEGSGSDNDAILLNTATNVVMLSGSSGTCYVGLNPDGEGDNKSMNLAVSGNIC